jgi:hypothetical protein
MKELHPDFIATCAGEPPPLLLPLLLMEGGSGEGECVWCAVVCVVGGGVQAAARRHEGAAPRLDRHMCR